TMDKSKKEVCTLRIMFPVESDERAIEIKKAIEGLLAEIPEAQVHFAIAPIPPRG
ncbi:unnamed protein product, partial [marine sediment metagenome]